MALTKTELYILKEVLSKVKYDELNERYTLYLEDYMSFNLKSSEIKVLRRLCQENDIFLEELPKILNNETTLDLFKQYNQIKQKLTKEKQNTTLKLQLYEVRNKIVEGHMKLIYKLINRYFPQITKERDKEDIYQTGYETLIELVDKYDASKNVSFIYFVSNYAMQSIVRKVYKSKANISNERAAELKRYKIASEHLEEQFGRIPTEEELIKATDLTRDKIEHLRLIEKFLEPVSVDYEEIDDIPDELIDYDFENSEIDKFLEQNEHLRKIIDILPDTQCKVIKLYYGFEDGIPHTNAEVATIIGNISGQRAQQIREHAIFLLINSINGEYLKDIYGVAKLNKKQKDGPKAMSIYQTFIEDLFIESIPKTELIEIVNELAPNYKEIMDLYYGLKNEYKHDFKEIGLILKTDNNKIRNLKKTCVSIVVKKYINKHKPNVKNTSLQYLINDYINSSTKRK